MKKTGGGAEGMRAGRCRPRARWRASPRIATATAIAEERFVNKLARQVGKLEQKVMDRSAETNPQGFLEELFRARHALLTVQTMTSQAAEIYGRAIGLLGGRDQAVDAALADNKDAYDRLSKITASQLAFLAGVTEYHRARTDTKMTIAAERLAVIAAVTLPITAISSVVGMNVISNDVTRWWWLGGLILVMLGLSLVLLRGAKRQGWW